MEDSVHGPLVSGSRILKPEFSSTHSFRMPPGIEMLFCGYRLRLSKWSSAVRSQDEVLDQKAWLNWQKESTSTGLTLSEGSPKLRQGMVRE